MIYTADTVYDDIEDKAVGDFGSGCGILSIASFIRGAGYVCTTPMLYPCLHIHKYTRYCVGFDIDPDAIRIARENAEAFETEIDFVWTDLGQENALFDRFKGRLDTIIMNPPFGTKNKGIDMVFLKKAVEVGTWIGWIH